MCNIAGYVGSERAAPVLLEMIQRQEGLAGGYYTGLATVHEGVVHWRKVVGDTARLRGETDAEDLPGHLGLAHSRSNSGGDENWAHPFVACDDRLAYVANGSVGKWADDPRLRLTAQRLADEGHRYRAVHAGPIGGYPLLKDGRCVHMSEVMAHAIEERLSRSGDPEGAIRSAFIDLPSEIVGMYISADYLHQICGARWNLPACAGRDASGWYIASSPAAFPGTATWWTWIPPTSVFVAGLERLCLSPLTGGDQAIPDDIDRAAAQSAVLDALGRGPQSFAELSKLADDLSPRTELVVRCDAIYEVLWRLERAGVIRSHTERVPGARPDLTAPRFVYRLADCEPLA